MNTVLENIKKRRSIRKYKEMQIEQEKIEAIIEAGLYAPSGHNAQPWHFTVLQNKEIIDQISAGTKEALKDCETPIFRRMARNESFHILYDAPTVIVVSGKKEGAYSMKADLGAATQNMLLAAESLGVSTCWIGLVVEYFKGEEKEKRNEEMGVPEGYEVQYAVTLGYSSLEGSPKPHARKENTVNYIK
ncbi:MULTISPECIES: nitroreductase family protein [Psychrilyobacter]|uniref:Nitroreductase family protein n=1 Tax=Psychrilyobacter piezotolerans TaxID=2293438 RepID=A0ABX9KF44_9FUSO|nr:MULTISPECIES: nitroreductase family protein [Psychrilyobacter]MCS5421578.1 nitroreductase family protein [Psychrilyobacter sp. S5]NDI78576.1 nitroreductase family protein [Psychrilyobacter piezotolerans]RDE60280.1 nitroreductase family protein [Psychrilyobacter sp. S5]REI40388.1 nitroreductase family protein [Psychrilyobacter piezotolerans]